MEVNTLFEFAAAYIEFITVCVCLCIGFLIKSWKRVPNKYIPTILALIGMIFSLWAAGWAATPETIFKGLVSGVAATGLYEAVKQYICKKYGVCKEEGEVND